MKSRLFLLLTAMLICGLSNAQYQNHYQMPTYGYENNMTFRAKICIDGVEQQSENVIEIGAFNGNTVSDSKFVKSFGSNHYYRVNMTIGGGSSSYELTFKLYDHENEVELVDYTITDPEGNPCEGITWQNDANLGTYKNPYVLNFISSNTYTKTILGYTGDKDHYYLLASPIGNVSPANVENMLANSYDLYYFDQTQDLEWINYKADNYNLVSGMGYLYANSEDVTLTFNGTPIEGNTYEVPLTMNDDAAFAGWNLIGNPFACNATVNVSNFYRMNADGTDIETSSGMVNAMEGIFVKATEDNETVTFTKIVGDTENGTTSGSNPDYGILNVNIIHQGNRVDLARVRFGEGNALEKFQINPSHTKIYFPVEGKDLAVVYPENQVGELPINFKAESNGNYTLSFNAQGLTASETKQSCLIEMFNYLHLVDNLTGANINLLETPNYSFMAQTTDYSNRFKLLFATGSSVDRETFAFINGMGNLTVFGIEGEATLQVIDVLGHVLSCETFSGNYERKLDVVPGVYTIRLINGSDIKIQKVIVK